MCKEFLFSWPKLNPSGPCFPRTAFSWPRVPMTLFPPGLSKKPDFRWCTTPAVSSAGALGYPDFGMRTLTEMVIQLEGVCRAVGVPVIADAEAGFGSVLNVVRMVQEYERVNVAGLHIEDQDVPRRCGHLTGKTFSPRPLTIQPKFERRWTTGRILTLSSLPGLTRLP